MEVFIAHANVQILFQVPGSVSIFSDWIYCLVLFFFFY